MSSVSPQSLIFITTTDAKQFDTSDILRHAKVYEEIAWESVPQPNDPQKYLILQEVEDKDMQSQVQTLHSVPDKDAEIREFRTIQLFNPSGHDASLAPQIMTVEITPSDVEDMHKWHREEHLNFLATLPGYKSSRRFEAVPHGSTSTVESASPSFLVINVVEDVAATFTNEAQGAGMTPWMIRVLGGCKVARARGWRVVQ